MTVNLSSVYCCSAMDLFSLGAGRYTGYTEFLIFLPLLQINSGSEPRINKGGLIEIFSSNLLSANQPTLCSWRSS